MLLLANSSNSQNSHPSRY